MADYYTSFSFAIPTENEAQEQWVLAYFEEPDFDAGDVDEDEWCQSRDGVMVSEEDGEMWVRADDGGNANNAAALVAAWQKEFNIQGPLSFEYSTGCSKPRFDAFRGGGVVVCKGEEYWAPSVTTWLSIKEDELINAGGV